MCISESSTYLLVQAGDQAAGFSRNGRSVASPIIPGPPVGWSKVRLGLCPMKPAGTWAAAKAGSVPSSLPMRPPTDWRGMAFGIRVGLRKSTTF